MALFSTYLKYREHEDYLINFYATNILKIWISTSILTPFNLCNTYIGNIVYVFSAVTYLENEQRLI